MIIPLILHKYKQITHKYKISLLYYPNTIKRIKSPHRPIAVREIPHISKSMCCCYFRHDTPARLQSSKVNANHIRKTTDSKALQHENTKKVKAITA